MADNISVTPGTGAIIAAENISGALVQRVKLSIGVLDTDDGDVSSTNPIPVTGALTDTQLRATAVPVSGTFYQATQPVSIATMPTTPVTGTFYQATQPVSLASQPLPTGAATETTLSALNTKVTAVNTGAVTISTALPAGTNAIGSITNTSFTATQATGTNLHTVVDNFPSSQAVTGTFWQATQPVSGTVGVSGSVAVTGPLTDTQLRATAVPVSGTVTANAGTGTFAVSAASLPLPAGASTSALQTTGNSSLSSIDTKTPALGQALAAASVPVVLTAAQLSTLTPPSSVSVSNFPASQAVTGTFWQATQPVSASSLPLPTGAATETTLSALNTKVTAVNTGAVTISTSLPAGTNAIGSITNTSFTATQATGSNLHVVVDSGSILSDVTGNVASGVTDSGNPVKVGGVYNSTLPTFTTGQRGDLQLDSTGRLLVNNTGPTPATTTGTITSTQSVAISIANYSSVSIEITGTWTGSIIFETLVGSTWSQADCFGTTTELVSGSTTVNGVFSFVNLAGVIQARVRGNTVVSGTATVVLNANSGNFTYPVYARSVGNSVGSYGIQMGGVDPTSNTYQFQKVNTLGAASVFIESSNKACYSGTIIPVTPPATPTDIVTLYGSATKTIRVLKMVVNTTQTTIGINDWYVIKRSTANSGGTSTAVTAVPNDSNFAAATAVLTRYTANPTSLGTSVGNISICNIVSPPSVPGTSGTAYVPYVFDFTNNPIVLRGTTQGIVLNFNGAALPAGLNINFNIVWTEE